MLTLNSIKEAAKRLEKVARATPLLYSEHFSRECRNHVYLKAENLQKTGSFKLRGAYNKISQLSAKDKKKGVICSSAGNHAQGVALAARKLGVKAVVVMPKTAPLIKIIATRNYGAEVILFGANYNEAYNKAMDIAKQRNLVFIHPFDDYEIMAGQGTIALEIFEKIKPDAIIVPVGGGGLISGIAAAAKAIDKKVKVIGVQAEGANSAYLSLKKRRLIKLDNVNTIADGLATKNIGQKTFEVIRKHVDDIVTVSDNEIAGTLLHFLEKEKLLAEPAGIVGLAALVKHKLNLRGKNVVVVISGGNIDTKMISLIIRHAMLREGRIFEFTTVLPDRPGALVDLSALIAGLEANIIEVKHERIRPYQELNKVEISLILETRNFKHINEIVKTLKKKGYSVRYEKNGNSQK